MPQGPVTEITTTEFKRHVQQPVAWTVPVFLGVWFCTLGSAFGGGLVVLGPSGVGLDPGAPLHVVGFALLALAFLVFGLFCFWIAVQAARDYFSGKVQILSFTVVEANPIRHRLALVHRDPAGRRRVHWVLSTWVPSQLPQEVVLWRTRYSHEPLRLRLCGEGLEYSVLDHAPGAP